MDTENHCMSSKQAKLILHRSGTQKTKKLAWVNKSDRRLPSKAHIIRQTLQLLFLNTHNEEKFPSQPSHLGTGSVRTWETFSNLRFLGFPDMAHITNQDSLPASVWHLSPLLELQPFQGPGVNRTWSLKAHLTCTAPNVVDLHRCKCHPNLWYEGSAKNPKLR